MYSEALKNRLAAMSLTVEVSQDYADRYTVRLNGQCVMHGFENDIWKWLDSDAPKGLDPEKLSKAKERATQGAPYTPYVDLPNWDHLLHVGAFVRSKNGGRYTLVDIHDDGFGVIVPISFLESPAVCAYVVRLDTLEAFDLLAELGETL